MSDVNDSVLEATLENQTAAVADDVVETGKEKLEVAPKPDGEGQTEEDKKFAAKFAALARKEKAQREREKQVAAKEKQLEDRLKELEAKLAAAEAPKVVPKKPLEDRLFENPFEALAEVGLDYENLTKTALNDGKLPVEIQMKRMQIQMQREFDAKLEAIQKGLSEKEEKAAKEAEERAKKQQEEQHSQVLTQFKSQISEHIEAQKENLQLVAQEGQYAVEEIYDLIAKDAQQKKEEAGDDDVEIELMSIEEAASKVEERLLNKAKDYAKLSKIQGLFSTPKADDATKAKQVTPAPSTLSNKQSQVQGPIKRNLSEQDFLREVAAGIKFKVN